MRRPVPGWAAKPRGTSNESPPRKQPSSTDRDHGLSPRVTSCQRMDRCRHLAQRIAAIDDRRPNHEEEAAPAAELRLGAAIGDAAGREHSLRLCAKSARGDAVFARESE